MVCGGGSSVAGALSKRTHASRNRVLSTLEIQLQKLRFRAALPASDSITNKMFHFIAAK